MTVQTAFDVPAFSAAVRAGWDAGELHAWFADEVEFTEIDHTTPPSAPAVLRGRQAVAEALRDAASRGIAGEVVDALVSGERAALAIRCRYPTGEQVHGHVFIDLRDGRIARWASVQAWDE